jgi:CDP-diacylglycerol--glycerol-3-phosphate 3-phosphatidyltransferase
MPPFTFTDWLRRRTARLTSRLGQLGAQLGLHPDVITALGLVLAAFAAILAGAGQFTAAGIVLVLGAPLDALDGAVARAMNRTGSAGALLDSVTDRYADAFLFGGMTYYFAVRGESAGVLLGLAALIGAYGVSYVRARAEGLGIGSIREGLFDRVVRILILIGMLLTGWVVAGLIVLAVGSHLTALYRLIRAYRAAQANR